MTRRPFACHIDESAGQRLPMLAPEDDEPLAMCIGDELCAAGVDGHEPDCPVEQRLREEFGF